MKPPAAARAPLASVALVATLAAATSAPAPAGATAASNPDPLLGPTVGQRFGCSFSASLAEDFSNHIAPKGSMRCNPRRIADLKLTLLKNGIPQPHALVVKLVTVPSQTDPFAAKGSRCSPAWYRSELTVRLFHNGTSTLLHAESRRVFLRPSYSRPPACEETIPKR
jgi:hypothetical protein